MDWTKVKSAIGTFAPWIAGTFGTPAAGVAVKGLCSIFGLDSSTATPESVSTAIATATPEQLLALKQADLKHQEFMAQIGYDSLEKLAQATVEDRSSARQREVAVKDKTPAILATVAIVAFAALVYYVATGSAPNNAMHDTFMMLTGAAVALVKDVYGYYFGSSAGSHAKDATIASLSQQGGS